MIDALTLVWVHRDSNPSLLHINQVTVGQSPSPSLCFLQCNMKAVVVPHYMVCKGEMKNNLPIRSSWYIASHRVTTNQMLE